jgi:hypothetical protein
VCECVLTEVDEVGAHAAALRAVGAREGRGAVLQRRVLLADGRVVQRDVHHLLVAPDQERRLPVDVQDRQGLVALERVKPVRNIIILINDEKIPSM